MVRVLELAKHRGGIAGGACASQEVKDARISVTQVDSRRIWAGALAHNGCTPLSLEAYEGTFGGARASRQMFDLTRRNRWS
ncbi:MAG: hypothetical protein QOJ74_2376 [Ilumatobacteraceae bacterium]|nr:hypothetical protein [Ilumatobacteraceae bacterium]